MVSTHKNQRHVESLGYHFVFTTKFADLSDCVTCNLTCRQPSLPNDKGQQILLGNRIHNALKLGLIYDALTTLFHRHRETMQAVPSFFSA